MTIALLIISVLLNLLLASLVLFLRERYKALQGYTRKANTERLAMAIELGELRDAAGYIRFR